MDKIGDYSQIQDAIIAIKAYKEGFITNFFMGRERCNLMINRSLFYIVDYGKCMFIMQKDCDFFHVYYITINKEELAISLKKLVQEYTNNSFVVDIIGTKAITDSLSEIFIQNGFEKHVELYRMSRTKDIDLSQILDQRVEFAKREDSEQLFFLLKQYFDPYSEQIPLLEEIDYWIKEQRILVIYEQEKIIGFIIFEINGVTSYLRYWFTHPDYRDKKVGSALLRRFFYECRETKRQLFWVIENNENAITRYKHYGFEPEQMFDQVLINKKQKNETTNY